MTKKDLQNWLDYHSDETELFLDGTLLKGGNGTFIRLEVGNPDCFDVWHKNPSEDFVCPSCKRQTGEE